MIITIFSKMDCILPTKTFLLQGRASRLVGMFAAFLKIKRTYYIWKHQCSHMLLCCTVTKDQKSLCNFSQQIC